MTKINNNNNIEALKVFYGAKQARKAEVEEKQQKAEEVKEFEPKKVQASALDALAAQIKGGQLAKVDTSDAAVEKRIAEGLANSPFMKALDDIFEERHDVDFVQFAQNNISGVNHDKLAKYLNKGLSEEVKGNIQRFADNLTL